MHYIYIFALRSSEMLQLYSLKLIVKQSYGKICTHTPIKTYDAVQFYSVQYSLSFATRGQHCRELCTFQLHI